MQWSLQASWMPAVVRTFIIMSNERVESGNSCSILDFKGKPSSFPPLSMMVSVFLSCEAFIML